MKKQLFAALVVMVAAGMTSSVMAASDDGQQPADVNVTVAEETAIDVHPQQLTYAQITPGSIADDGSEARSFGAVELENVGSTDIERVWVNASQTTQQDPFFGSSTPSEFNAANFLQLKPNPNSDKLEGDSGNWTFVNRRDYGVYNNSIVPEYIKAPDTGSYYVDTNAESTATAADVAVGRFRMGQNEYFWALPVGSTPGECDGSSDATFNTLLVAKQPHNASYTTPVDFEADSATDPDGTSDEGYNTIPGRDYYIYNLTTDGSGTEYGVADTGNDGSSGGIPLKDTSSSESDQIRQYDVLTRCDTVNTGSHDIADQPHTIRTKYNVEAGGYTNLAQTVGTDGAPESQYLISSNTLLPGEVVKLDVRVMVPRGIPQGEVTEGVLRVVASTTS